MAKKNIFTEVNFKNPSSNTFDLSHDRKMSIKMGRLVPTMLLELVPGDVFNIQTAHLLRFAPMVAPVMHSINVYMHYFFVPNRLLWPNWEDFITGGEDGLDASVFPYVDLNFTAMTEGTIGDYFGLPVGENTGAASHQVSALPINAYAKIYDEYFRDQNLIAKLWTPLVNGDNSVAWAGSYNADPIQRCWQHDYFTSALPWTQKGPEATIPLGTQAPIAYQFDYNTVPLASGVNTVAGTPFGGPEDLAGDTGRLESSAGSVPLQLDISNHHYADLSTATAAGIVDLRRAFKLQEWLEKNARGGSRYIESILAHFGVRSSDARLQRPEFLGGTKSPVNISEVLQTSATDTEPTPQGNMAGHGISVGQNRSIRYYAEEHGYIIGLMSVLPVTAYYQGIPRHFTKFDKFDYFWPEFAQIGEQPIYNKELFVTGVPNDDDETFGYIPRYAEYKFIPSSVHGVFRSSLDFWHMARQFATPPQLNEDFVKADPRTDIFAVTEVEQLYVHLFNSVKATRKMPFFGNPKM